MTSPSNILYELMVSLVLGTDPSLNQDWPIFVSLLPDEPDEAICIYDTAGRLGGRLMMDGTQIEHPGIQIRVRGKDYSLTYNKAKTIALTLDAQYHVPVIVTGEGTFTVQNISRTGAIIPLGVDEADGRRNSNFTINAVLSIMNP